MIMVRRRGRPVKDAAAAAMATHNNVALNGEAVVTASAIANAANLLEDQYFASPKRKDCRLMQTNEDFSALDMVASIAVAEGQRIELRNATVAKHKTAAKQRSEQIVIDDDRDLGVPLATRSQTRTIENFFKANAAAKNTKTTICENAMQKTISSNISECNSSSSPETVKNGNEQVYHHDDEDEVLRDEAEEEEDIYHESSPTPPPYTLIGEESNDTDNSVPSTLNTMHPVNGMAILADFQSHRSTLRDSHSSHGSSSTTENLFLQEPVLKLDIDKSPNQASSIKINKSFEVGSIFSSPPALSACVLNGRFNQIVTLNGCCSPVKQEIYALSVEAPLINNNGFVLDHDSSSCDSGVAFVPNANTTTTGATDATKNSLMPQQVDGTTPNAAQTRRRKPATPHRILCPSPIKAMPRDHIIAGIPMSGARKVAAALKESLSPRKSQRQLSAAIAAVSCKTRRRLNQPNKEQTPYKTHTAANIKNMQEDIVIIDDDDEDDDDAVIEDVDGNAVVQITTTTNGDVHNMHQHHPNDEEAYENVSSCVSNSSNVPHMTTNTKIIESNTRFNGNTKSILNSAKHPTARQNTTNNKNSHKNNVKINQHELQQQQQQQQQNSKTTAHKGAKPKTINSTTTTMLSTTTNAVAVTNNYHNTNKVQNAKTNNNNANKKTQLPLAANNNGGNRELTDFFPVRRSVRKTKTAVKEEMMRNLEQAVLEERAEGLKIAYFEGKGRGVIADRHFKRGEFVIEYIGDLISMTEAGDREKRYALDENAGCYMYYFKHKNQQYCIDATVDTGKLGRLVNHSRNGNLVTKVVVVKQRPHLVLLAKEEIEAGEELCYDYGDRSKESLLHHPWLAF